MFDCPEHALAVAFAIIELPIEPKSATLLVVQAMEERYGVGIVKLPTGLSPHDWHAQAVFTLQMARRALAPYSMLWEIVEAEYHTGVAGALAIQKVSAHIRAAADSRARLLNDLLVMRIMRRKPVLRHISDEFDVPMSTLWREERKLHGPVADLRQRAIDLLRPVMEARGLVLRVEAASRAVAVRN